MDYTINAKDYECTVKRVDETSKCDICQTNVATFQVSYYPKE